MIRRITVVLAAVLASSCSTMPGDDGGVRPDSGFSLMVDAGPPAIRYTKYTKRTDGWPAGARIVGVAFVNGALYAAHTQGLSRLLATETTWTTETTALTGDLKPTSLQRVDQQLIMTAAGASSGGIFTRELDAPWVAVTQAPPRASWFLTRKGTEWLLAATGGLYVAPDLAGPWTRRSAMGTAVFSATVTHFLAAAGQQKLFASGSGANTGLFESTDLGGNWTASPPRGALEAISGTGPVVLASTAMDPQQRSDNYGNTFRPSSSPITDGVTFYTTDGTSFWAAGAGGLKRSSDQGVTFADDSSGLPSATPVVGLWLGGSYLVAETAEGPWVNQVQ